MEKGIEQMMKLKPQDFIYSEEHDAWFAGDLMDGIGILRDDKEEGKWCANVVVNNDLTFVDGCYSKSHAMAEGLKTFERLSHYENR